MKTKLIPLSILLLVGLLVSGYILPSVLNNDASQVKFQATPAITLVPPVQSTPVVVVPVTGDGANNTTLLFYGILILAGLAFLVMLFALMRRPNDRL